MKYKLIMLIFGVSAALSGYFRMKQMITTIDDKGFVINTLSSDNFFLLLAILGLLAVSVTAAFFTRRCPIKAPKVGALLGLSSALLGGWMVFDSVTVTSPVSVPSWQSALLAVFGVASGVLFIVYAVSGVAKIKIPAMLFILPVFYWMIRLVWVFTALNTLALTIEHILLLLNCSVLLVFMLQYAKLMNMLNRHSNYVRIQIIGIASILLSIDYALTNVLFMVLGKRSFAISGVSSEILILLTALFILMFMIAFFDEGNLKHRSRSRRRRISHPGTGKDSFYIGGSR